MTYLDHLPLKQWLDFAVDAAWQAGRVTRGYFQSALPVEWKADHTPVTAADRQAEARLRELIGHYWPDHGIVGEELGRQAGAANITWILDPIDGTRSFIAGVPLYATLVALTVDQQPVLGVAHFPALDETVYAAAGHGCYWDGRRVHTSPVANMGDALLLSSEMAGFEGPGKGAAWGRLLAAAGTRRTWGDAYGYALVATGRAEVMVDTVMEVWDCGPLQVILEEAGGTFTDWQGTPTIYNREGVATNGALFDQVMKLIKGE
jgi:histidinol phosphatase-like enzyme (inositol monophosphatase family)